MSGEDIGLTYRDAEVVARLQRLKQKAGDLAPAFRRIGELLLLSTDRRWEQQVDPSGQPWRENTPYTIQLKEQRKQIQKVLQATGRGRASITYQASPDTLRIGTNVGYMRKHQLGIGVVQRRFLGISEADRLEILATLGDYLKE